MLVMALDHVRDWVTNVRFPPEDLSRASAALFATRWITHFCAPTFFLLAGLGIGLLMQREARGAHMARYLLTRGAWLLVLELVITFSDTTSSTRSARHRLARSAHSGRSCMCPAL